MTVDEMAEFIVAGLDGAYDFASYAKWHRGCQLDEDVIALKIAAAVLHAHDMETTAKRVDFLAGLLRPEPKVMVLQ